MSYYQRISSMEHNVYSDLRAGRLTLALVRTVIELCVCSLKCRGPFMLRLLPIAFELNDLSSVSFL